MCSKIGLECYWPCIADPRKVKDWRNTVEFDHYLYLLDPISVVMATTT